MNAAMPLPKVTRRSPCAPLMHIVADVRSADAALHSEFEGVEKGRRQGPIDAVRKGIARELTFAALDAKTRIRHACGVDVFMLKIPASMPGDIVADLIVQSSRGIDVARALCLFPRERVLKQIGTAGLERTLRGAAVDRTQRLGDRGIYRRRVSGGDGELQQVDRVRRAIGS